MLFSQSQSITFRSTDNDACAGAGDHNLPLQTDGICKAVHDKAADGQAYHRDEDRTNEIRRTIGTRDSADGRRRKAVDIDITGDSHKESEERRATRQRRKRASSKHNPHPAHCPTPHSDSVLRTPHHTHPMHLPRPTMMHDASAGPHRELQATHSLLRRLMHQAFDPEDDLSSVGSTSRQNDDLRP